jgi:hypothetical protein
MPKIQFQFLIDSFPSITMGFDFRKLRSAYSGNAIRVLRTSDNTEQDFGFVSNEVVGSDIVDFVGWNLLAYSEDISQTTYQKVNLVATGTPPYIDVETAPNGTLTADKLIENTSFTNHFLTQTLGITVVGLDYNFSVYLKAGERTKTDIQAGGVGQARINLLTGAIETSTFPITPIVTDAGNGWWRFSVTFNANSTLINPLYRIFTVNNLNQSSYVGDGVSGVYVWGFQLTQSSTLLAYDKTGATARGYGSISKRYDQATGGDDVINATIIRQPIIVNGGNIITDGGKLALQGGATLGLRSTNTLSLSAYSDLLMTFGLNVTNVTTQQYLFESSTAYTSNNGALGIFIQGNILYVTQRISSTISSRKTYPISTGRQLITIRFRTGQVASDASQVWINGIEISGTVTLNNNSTTLSNQVIYLFARGGNSIGFLGKYQNFTMFTDSTQRAGIENNINNYYGYY